MNLFTLIKSGIVIALLMLVGILSYSMYMSVQYEKYGQSTFGKIVSIKKIPQSSKSSFEIRSFFKLDGVRYYTDDSCLKYSFGKKVGDSIEVLYLKNNPNISCHICFYESKYSIESFIIPIVLIQAFFFSFLFFEKIKQYFVK